jgi:hypothetical protein
MLQETDRRYIILIIIKLKFWKIKNVVGYQTFLLLIYAVSHWMKFYKYQKGRFVCSFVA